MREAQFILMTARKLVPNNMKFMSRQVRITHEDDNQALLWLWEDTIENYVNALFQESGEECSEPA